ncbi:MAG: hypothetical protein ACLQDY_04585 [Streptosporangiaceae bacterium]
MRIAGRPLFWLIAALVIFLLWRAPEQVSGLLAAIGHLFAAIAEGIARFLGAIVGRPWH